MCRLEDDSKIVTASSNGLHLWNVGTGGKLAGPFHAGFHIGSPTPSEVCSVTFAFNDDLILSGLRDGCIHIKDIKHPYFISRCLNSHNGPVMSITVRPDREQFVSGSTDGTVHV